MVARIHAVGELQVDYSSFLRNEAQVSGGAIQANSTLTVNHSTFLDNLAVIRAGVPSITVLAMGELSTLSLPATV